MLTARENIKESKLQYLFASTLEPGTFSAHSTTPTPSSMARGLIKRRQSSLTLQQVVSHHPLSAKLFGLFNKAEQVKNSISSRFQDG